MWAFCSCFQSWICFHFYSSICFENYFLKQTDYIANTFFCFIIYVCACVCPHVYVCLPMYACMLVQLFICWGQVSSSISFHFSFYYLLFLERISYLNKMEYNHLQYSFSSQLPHISFTLLFETVLWLHLTHTDSAGLAGHQVPMIYLPQHLQQRNVVV